MVLLTMTPLMVEALEKLQAINKSQNVAFSEIETSIEGAANQESSKDNNEEIAAETCREEQNSKDIAYSKEPSLSNLALGNPISHSQVIDIWRELKATTSLSSTYTLEALLQGSNIYIPPPPPKPEPTSEYKALMARLRAEEEARTYEKMTTSSFPSNSSFPSSSPFPNSKPSLHPAFATPIPAADLGDSDLMYADINRQLTTILNILISIACCAVAIWIAARWWSTPARLALSMSGSLLVGVAEVVVFGGYLRRVGEAKEKEKERGMKEVREVVGRWVVGGDNGKVVGDDDDNDGDGVLIGEKKEQEGGLDGGNNARKRK
ncbi:hypothetical protein B7463_g2910, partial [Scytalidium lignicola]